jgi:hypothetical protein
MCIWIVVVFIRLIKCQSQVYSLVFLIIIGRSISGGEMMDISSQISFPTDDNSKWMIIAFDLHWEDTKNWFWYDNFDDKKYKNWKNDIFSIDNDKRVV